MYTLCYVLLRRVHAVLAMYILTCVHPILAMFTPWDVCILAHVYRALYTMNDVVFSWAYTELGT